MGASAEEEPHAFEAVVSEYSLAALRNAAVKEAAVVSTALDALEVDPAGAGLGASYSSWEDLGEAFWTVSVVLEGVVHGWTVVT